MLALLDGDIVAYRCSAVTEKNDFGLCKWQTDQLITRIIEDVDATDWKIFLTAGNNNFRYQIYPEYKANRREAAKPRHLEDLREYLVLSWDAQLCDGYEADDALGIYSRMDGGTSYVVCSIDKDLLQLPGYHYNFVKREIKEVNEFDGAKQFYTQLLCGDSTDNIRGCPGIGSVKAERAFKGCNTERELYEAVVACYQAVYKDEWFKHLNLNAQLLYVWRVQGDQWTPPEPSIQVEPIKQEVVVK